MPNIGNAVATLSSFYDEVGSDRFLVMATMHILPPEVEEALQVVKGLVKDHMLHDTLPGFCIFVIQ